MFLAKSTHSHYTFIIPFKQVKEHLPLLCLRGSVGPHMEVHRVRSNTSPSAPLSDILEESIKLTAIAILEALLARSAN